MKVRVINIRDQQFLSRNAISINTTSASNTWSKGLSPFLIGPCDLYSGYKALNMENAWQFTKVYPQHLDSNDNPSDKYWRWAIAGWKSEWAFRYPMGKGAIPKYSYWDGEKLGYIAARKKIYIPLYREAVRHTYAYKKLRDIYQTNKVIYIYDYDSYDNIRFNMSMRDVINSRVNKMGHAFVLAMMLRESI